MNKKFISSFVALVLVFNVSVCFSAEKKDVTDPVLREMINSLSTKMPKFINQYGASVFVEDEKITRGALIRALYEYDKKTSGGAPVSSVAAGVEDTGLTKKQYTALSNRISALERNSASTTGGKAKQSVSGSVDIIAVMNDLEPNMPMLLDNTLAQSKVFKALQRKVALVSAGSNSSGSGTFANDDSVLSKSDTKNILAVRKEIAALNKKIDKFELELAASGVSTANDKKSKNKKSKTKDSTIDSNELEEMNAKLAQIQKSYIAMSKKVNALELASSNDSTTNDKKSKNKKSKTKDSTIDSNELEEMNTKLAQIQKSYIAMSKKVNALELASSNDSTTNDKKSKNKKSKTKDSTIDSNELEEMKAKLTQIQKSYVAMSKRVNELETTQQSLTASSYASPTGKGTGLTNAQVKNINSQIASIKKTVANIPTNDYVDAEIQKANVQTAKDIKRIENRLNNLKRSGNFVESESKDTESSSEGSSKTGTIAKISLGLTMIAALFIAR